MGRGRPLNISWQEDGDTLFQAYRQEKSADIKPRLHALWLLRLGHLLRETAQIVGVHYRTLQQWVTWHRQGGLAAVRGHPRGGQVRTLLAQ